MRSKYVPAVLGVVMLGESAAFAVGSLAHVPLKIWLLDEPRIVPAVIVEALCAITLGAGGVAVLRRWENAWSLAFSVHLLTMVGVAVGIAALAAGRGPRTITNDIFHYIVLSALGVGTISLWKNEHQWRRRLDSISVRSHGVD